MGTFYCTSGNVFIAIFVVFLIPVSRSVNFQLSRFSPDASTDILLEGDAKYSPGDEVIELNQADIYRVGRVIYNGKVPIWDLKSGKLTDFTTHFSFTVTFTTPNKLEHGDGFAFFLAPAGFQIPPNSAGIFFGLFNDTDYSPQRQIVTVKFDTAYNVGPDPRYEHVGINRNSIESLVTKPWNATAHSGDPADAWIIYNATTKNLSVFWSYGGGPNSSLEKQIDLKEVLPEWATVGFSSSTGLWVEKHTLRSWEFSSSLDIKQDNEDNAKNIGLVVGLTLSGCILIAGAVAAFVVWRKWRESIMHSNNLEATNLTSINDDLERGSGPRKFSYKELALATNNFSDGRKLGEGGFGRVYKGHLLDLDLPIAVKKFSRGSKQGKKQYITEVKIISMLRHRNLVRLIGWCHDQGEFLLVYEFMPNGSLDHHLFGEKNTLDWTLRYKISLGLASSLLYLHEGWEQCVIHRDIKSSNVMLDSSFSVKLGDFGLARLMDHGLTPQTTGLAGTFGYMAPEYVSTGRASKESDVYSFGVVVLEIATGRKPVNVGRMAEQSDKVLVEWVWDLYGNGELLSAVDERLKMDFEPNQAERMMIVGLWCAHPDSSLRPSIRQASHVLNFEADLPQLPSKMPVAIYYPPSLPSGSWGEYSTTSSSMNTGR